MATHIDIDEPLTPTGRLFAQPEVGLTIHCYIGGQNPIDIAAVKSVIQNSIMVKHYRFSSLLVVDRHGRDRWKKTTIDLNRHIIVVPHPVGPGTDEEAVNEYVADLAVSSPLSTDKPLWEVHLLMAHNCAVLRLHHAVGDGTSLMSMLAYCGSGAGDSDCPRRIIPAPSLSYRTKVQNSVWGFVKTVWFTIIYSLDLLWRILWVKDNSPVSGGAGTEMWPRKLATAKFVLADMVKVKNAVPRATINDVLCGVISAGLSRYLDILSTKPVKKDLKITGLAMVNLRPRTGLAEKSKSVKTNCITMTWFNDFGMTLLPIYYQKAETDSLNYVRQAKKTNDRKKQSLEPFLTRSFLAIVMSMSNIGRKLASFISYRMMSSISFTISNMVGPKEEITIAGNPVKFLRITTTSLPHAITMHMVSYAGKADLQILVAKDIIPEPQLLATFMEEALLQMKQAAKTL